ncbi:bactofilin family protein [Brevibacillus daliensis]|uniref:bactofilin family protein n=1 Tax=Brevibacillus daliensis TaxID=2892995 RepID=UPI001E53CCB3|nr:polymer-forming cytoskeletal protein [Brevibacillus daliensis]
MKPRALLVILLICSLFIAAGAAHALGSYNQDYYNLPVNEHHEGDLFIYATTAVIDGTVEGDLYVFADTLIIKGKVTGDVISFTNKITVEGIVEGNLRSASQFVIIPGQVKKNASTFANNFRIPASGNLNGSLVGFTHDLFVDGKIGKETNGFYRYITISGTLEQGTSWIRTERMQLTPTSVVNGDLNYNALSQAIVEPGATINGEHQYTAIEEQSKIKPFLMMTLTSAISTLIFWLLIRYFFTSTLQTVTNKLSERPLKLFLKGLIILIVTPIICISILFTVVGIPIGVVGLISFFLLYYLAKIYVGSWLGHWIITRLHYKWKPLVAEFVGVLLLVLLLQIPYLGWGISLVVSTLFLGAVGSSVRDSNRQTYT